ncbi:carboxypeptidase-like regulatory domain-containing protein, partial [Chitinophaga sp.]|uniref:carboxypeptidase-like regulatory domain-containing protein n=1 Tax=Chitinophaga sp. TaxID=1869181 RepID=UPI002F95F27D
MVFNIHAKRNSALRPAVTSTPGLSKLCMIAKLTFLLMMLGSIRVSAAINQDTVIISGTITDSTGTPMPGVLVKVSGASQATTSDVNGHYRLARIPEGATLIFSMMGYVPQQIKASGSQLNVHLRTGTRILDEVVITDGYRTTTRAANTSAIGTIGGAALENKPFSTFMQSMQGKIAGVSAPLTSGQPGGNVNIRIRGVGSLSLSSDPLIVVDGMIVNSGSLSGAVTTSNALA